MSEKEVSKQERYWIKPDIAVAHVGLPEKKMYVLRLLRKRVRDHSPGAKKKTKDVVAAVLVRYEHNGKLKTKTFRTNELMPFVEPQEKKNGI